jgi:hypothetical protein
VSRDAEQVSPERVADNDSRTEGGSPAVIGSNHPPARANRSARAGKTLRNPGWWGYSVIFGVIDIVLIVLTVAIAGS